MTYTWGKETITEFNESFLFDVCNRTNDSDFEYVSPNTGEVYAPKAGDTVYIITEEWRNMERYLISENEFDMGNRCAICDCWVFEDYGLVDSVDGLICECCADEYERCSECGRLCHNDDMHDIHTRGCDVVAVCDGCLERGDIYECCECGDLYYTDYGEFDEYDDFYCNECIEDGCGHFGMIRPYGTKVGMNEAIRTEPRTSEPYIGIELEVDDGYNRDDAAKSVEDILGDDYVIFKEDGSLTEQGFEINTVPATLKTHLEKSWKEAMATLISYYDYSSHNAGTCGLHIHIDKNYFGSVDKQELGIARMLLLFSKHRENLIRFSRRRGNQISEWCNFNNDCSPQKFLDDYKKRKHGLVSRYQNPSRYRAVNCTRNTIEIRIWRGTLRYETFIATLKLTCRLAELCKNTNTIPLIKMSWDEILGDDPDILNYWEHAKYREV